MSESEEPMYKSFIQAVNIDVTYIVDTNYKGIKRLFH